MKRTVIIATAGLSLVALNLWLLRGGAGPAIDAREAYQRGDYAAAVREYQRAAPDCGDLAAVAANQGAALYRLDRYGDAAKRYQLAESAGADARAARAAYDGGNCVLRESCQDAKGPDSTMLEQAVQHFRACLARETEIADAGDLFSDARHNLELIKLLQVPAPAEQQAIGAAQRDVPGDQPSPGRSEIEANNPSRNGRSDDRSSADASTSDPRPTATFANFLARRDDDDYLCPECRRELERVGLNPGQGEDKPNSAQTKNPSQDSGEEAKTKSPANGERRDGGSAESESQARRQSQDAKQANPSNEQQKLKEKPRDEGAGAAGGESGEWSDQPKEQQGKEGPT